MSARSNSLLMKSSAVQKHFLDGVCLCLYLIHWNIHTVLLWLLHGPFKFSIRNPEMIFVIRWETYGDSFYWPQLCALLFVTHPHIPRNHSWERDVLFAGDHRKWSSSVKLRREEQPRCCIRAKRKMPAAVHAFLKNFAVLQCMLWRRNRKWGRSASFYFQKTNPKRVCTKGSIWDPSMRNEWP